MSHFDEKNTRENNEPLVNISVNTPKDQESKKSLVNVSGWQLVIGFLIGMITPLSPVLQEWVKSDTERRVLDGIVNERKALMENQSEYLKLQEVYLSKLKDLNDKEIAISRKNEDLNRMKLAQTEIRNSYEQKIRDLEGIELTCPVYSSGTKEKVQKNTNKQIEKSKIESLSNKYMQHRCISSTDYHNEPLLSGGKRDCRIFYKSIFNVGGPDEKIFEKARKYPGACNYTGDSHEEDIRETLSAMCENHQHEYLKSEGLTPNEIKKVTYEIARAQLEKALKR